MPSVNIRRAFAKKLITFIEADRPVYKISKRPSTLNPGRLDKGQMKWLIIHYFAKENPDFVLSRASYTRSHILRLTRK
jgi:hypothetical protein